MRHYQRFLKKLDTLSVAEAASFEAKCIAEGWVDEKQQGRRPKKDEDPFDVLAREVQAESSADIGAAVAREEREQAAEEQAMEDDDVAQAKRDLARAVARDEASRPSKAPRKRRKAN